MKCKMLVSNVEEQRETEGQRERERGGWRERERGRMEKINNRERTEGNRRTSEID